MKAKRLDASTIKLKLLSDKQIGEMYNVYQKYYGNVSREVFSSDLSNKNHVIILTDKYDGEIKGFSTILDYHFELEGKKSKEFSLVIPLLKRVLGRFCPSKWLSSSIC